MAKKIIDIFPPKSKIRPAQKLKRQKQETRRSIWKHLLTAVLLISILTFFSLHFFFSKAEIKIWPQTEPFLLTERVAVDTKAGRHDLSSKVIPGKIFEIEKILSEEFQATGISLKKAEGKIRLYNSFTTGTETWLQGTRFVSSEGKLFFSKNRITVPGTTLKNGRIAPSFVDVQVVAAEAGPEYNIGPSNFSIAAFLGTARYTKYYGESSEPMTGGGQVAKVLKEDLEKAENMLVEKAKKEAEEELRRKTPDGFVILAQPDKQNILEKSSSAKEGDEVEKFEFLVKTKLPVVSFELKDLEEFSRLSVASRIPEGKNFHPQGTRTEYQVESFNQESGEFLLSLSVFTKIYPTLDLDSLKRGLVAKPLFEAKILLADKEEFSRAEIKVFPFWLKSLPNTFDRIKIDLMFAELRSSHPEPIASAVD